MSASAVRACGFCDTALVRRKRENAAKWRARRFCSRGCAARATRSHSQAEIDALYANYLVDPETGCWIFGGHIDRNGYGRIYDPSQPYGKRSEWAHRAFYRRYRGPIPRRHEIDHECQNTACVNPAHLAAVTRAEHVRRTWERLGIHDRHRLAAEMRAVGATYAEIAEALELGTRSGAAQAVRRAIAKGLVDGDAIPARPPLTESERADIRDLYVVGVPQPELAAWYGDDSAHISRICSRRDSKSARNSAPRESHLVH